MPATTSNKSPHVVQNVQSYYEYKNGGVLSRPSDTLLKILKSSTPSNIKKKGLVKGKQNYRVEDDEGMLKISSEVIKIGNNEWSVVV